MSQNISWLGNDYSDVPYVELPKTGGGDALFVDPSPTTAAAADVASGKLFFDALGVLTQGTASGGGGSNWTFLASKEFTVNTSSTSNTSVGSIELDLSKYKDYQTVLWVHIRDKAGLRNGYCYGSDTIFFHFQLVSGNTNSLSIRPIICFKGGSSSISGAASAYGVFAYRLYYTSSSHYVEIYSRYNNSNSGTINGTYKCEVYKLTMPSGMTLFPTT